MSNHSKAGRSHLIINWKRKISCYEYTFLEFLALRIDFVYRLLTKWRKEIFLKEIKMAKVSSKDRVLFIGCGILPTGPMILAEETKAKIVTIDNNIKAAKLAQSYIRKKGLSDAIKIEYADGENYPVEKFDVIFIATNVWPIDSILKRMSSNMKIDARILCKGIKNDVLDVLDKEGLREVFSVDSVSENPKTYSFLLTKNKRK